METLEALSTADKYVELFRQNRGLIGNGDPDFMENLREEAIRSFEETGFPLRKQENYKYTHLEPGSFRSCSVPGPSALTMRSSFAVMYPCSMRMFSPYLTGSSSIRMRLHFMNWRTG